MFWRSKQSKRNQEVVQNIYNIMVSSARHPIFYQKYGVPDTLDGRFELLIMHVFILHKVAKQQGVDDRLLQKLIDWMFLDFDHNLREIGVSDLGVAHRMKDMGKAFLGRYQAYEAAILKGDIPLQEVIARNLFGTVKAEGWQLKKMSQYMNRVHTFCCEQNMQDVMAGSVVIPSPESMFN